MVLIGIAGGSGSGKTTFAKKIQKILPHKNLGVLSMDRYYSPKLSPNFPLVKGRPNFDHPEAFDWEILIEHLKLLKNHQRVDVPVYNFKRSERGHESEVLGPCQAILFEGIFSLFSEKIRELLDIKCFLHVEADIRFTRRLHRDINERGRTLESVIEQYYETVRPMYQKFLDPQKQYADFTVGEETDVAARILAARVQELTADINQNRESNSQNSISALS